MLFFWGATRLDKFNIPIIYIHIYIDAPSLFKFNNVGMKLGQYHFFFWPLRCAYNGKRPNLELIF